MKTDLELIQAIKVREDNDATLELIDRHTGIYFNVVQRYAQVYPNIVSLEELRDDKMFNIYQAVLDYDPTKGTKFSTYLNERTDWLCKRLLKDDGRPTKLAVKNSDPLDEVKPDGTSPTVLTDETASGKVEESANRDLSLESILSDAKGVKDKRFVSILRWRHFTVPALTFRQIAPRLKISHERVRQIYDQNVEKVKRHLKERVA